MKRLTTTFMLVFLLVSDAAHATMPSQNVRVFETGVPISGLTADFDAKGFRLYDSTDELNLGTAAEAGTATGTGNVIVGGALEVDGVLYADGGITLPGAGVVTSTSRGTFRFSADGRVLLSNTTGTTFDGVVYGAATTSGWKLEMTSSPLTFNFLNGQGNLVVNYKGVRLYARRTVAADDTTPSIANGDLFITSTNTGATAITDLDDVSVDQEVTLCGDATDDANDSTLADSGNFSLTGAFTLDPGDCIKLWVRADNDYVEVSRSNN